MFTIASWNVNSIKARLPHVLDWLAVNKPDVLALQELKTVEESFPFKEIEEVGYQVVCNCQKAYNGVALLTKHNVTDVIKDIPGLVDVQRRIVAATINGIRILNLYVPNGQSPESEKYSYKLDWLAKVHDFISTELKQHERFVIVGDFNIAPTDNDIHDPAQWEGQVLFTEAEKNAFKLTLDLGFKDSFRLFDQNKVYTWWDYRMASFRRNLGARIDHILINDEFADKCISCVIDRPTRALERPSDHAPIMASFDGF